MPSSSIRTERYSKPLNRWNCRKEKRVKKRRTALIAHGEEACSFLKNRNETFELSLAKNVLSNERASFDKTAPGCPSLPEVTANLPGSRNLARRKRNYPFGPSIGERTDCINFPPLSYQPCLVNRHQLTSMRNPSQCPLLSNEAIIRRYGSGLGW